MPEMRRIILTSDHHYGKRLPPPVGLVIQLLPSLIADSVSMALRRRSHFPGKKPEWFTAVNDIRFIGHEGDDKSKLIFEVPRFGEAAPEFYQQPELWPSRPDASDTGFEVFGDVLRDISCGCRDSDRFDRGLLQHLLKLRPLFKRGIFRDIEVCSQRHKNGATPHLDPMVLRRAESIYRTTPTPRRLKLYGVLDMLRLSTQGFEIKLESGENATGVLVQGNVRELQEFLGHPVTVYGRAVYRPSGRLLRIDADEIVPPSTGDRFFTTIPHGTPQEDSLRRSIKDQALRRGLSAIIGHWPGDETDEQVQEALHHLS